MLVRLATSSMPKLSVSTLRAVRTCRRPSCNERSRQQRASDNAGRILRYVSGPVVVSAFYTFVAIDDVDALRTPLLERCLELEMFGSILVAPEGINGTIAGSRTSTDELFLWLRSDTRFTDLATKESFTDDVPFKRMKVRRKSEIVSLRQDVDPTAVVGTYVEPADWNDVIADPDVFVIDTRNVEEVSIGTFTGAVDPKTDAFSEFADWVDATLDPATHRKVAMFCTGGIRCEKASSYMLERGFPEVLHLNGGILNYLEKVPEAESMWEGECFVFDERVSVDHELQTGSYDLCRGCRRAISEIDRSSTDFEDGVSCPACIGGLTPEKMESLRERHRQERAAAARGERHVGQVLDD